MVIEREPGDNREIKIQDLNLDHLIVCISSTLKTAGMASDLYKILDHDHRLWVFRKFSSTADVVILCRSSKKRSGRKRFKNRWVIDFDCREFDESCSDLSKRLDDILLERSRIPEQRQF